MKVFDTAIYKKEISNLNTVEIFFVLCSFYFCIKTLATIGTFLPASDLNMRPRNKTRVYKTSSCTALLYVYHNVLSIPKSAK